MFDTMTLTKASAGVIATLLVFMLGKWAADSIYLAGSHGDHAAGYEIVVAAAETSDEPVDEGPAFAEVYASADAAAGADLWRNCRSCHSNEPGVNGTGPSLHGVFDRDIAGEAGYAFSDALIALEGNWTADALNGFLESPKSYAPGTKMGYNGMRKITDRANLIAYLDSLDD